MFLRAVLQSSGLLVTLYFAPIHLSLPAAAPPIAAPALVPWPRSIKVAPGRLTLGASSRIVVQDNKLLPLGRLLADELRLLTGLQLTVVQTASKPGDIVLTLTKGLKGDNYRLVINDRVTVSAASYKSAALGSVTLLQTPRTSRGRTTLPRMTIEDGPRFSYNGAMLDLARKPYTIDTLKQCITVCRFYKIRFLHLHLSDENAWVFPSTAFPKLGSHNFAWAGGNKPVVYKLADLKDLVAFADVRGVTLVPEIEMPGHSGQLRGTMPDIFGYKDQKGKTVTLGVLNMIDDRSIKTLDTIIGEVCAVFKSSPFVHLGCDEASLGGMEAIPAVKAFMAKHKMKSTHAVFNAFVLRMHAIVKKHGKRAIVWEGAPLDPVAPPKDLIVMPWVGGSTLAGHLVKQGYDVINAPWGVKSAYFDPYLVNGSQLKHGEPRLFGATSILWESPEEAALPYLRSTGALRNEPTWNPSARRGHANFLRRLRATAPALDRLLYGFTLQTEGTLDPLVFMRPDALFGKQMTLTLATRVKTGQVRYTRDGSEPTARSPLLPTSLKLTKDITIKARLFDGKNSRSTLTRTYRKVPMIAHDAVGASVTIHPNLPGYPGPGARGLTDGFLADGDQAGSAGWVGWERGPVEIRLDLGKVKTITSLGSHFLRAGGGIAPPASVEFAVSLDGKTFKAVATVMEKEGASQRGWYTAKTPASKARHVRIKTTAGGDWTFLDEVAVNLKLPAPAFRHAALGKPVTLAHAPSAFYAKPGVKGLTDGHLARSPDCLNLEWLGIEGKNFEATIDLGKTVEIRRAGAHFMQQVRVGVTIPPRLDVFVSDDGKTFRKVGTVLHKVDNTPTSMKTLAVDLKGVKGRYVRLVSPTNGLWLFADEVFVNPE